jgi:hypothetical protein
MLRVSMSPARPRRFHLSVEPWSGGFGRKSAVCVMLWSLEGHTRLLEAHQFRDYAALAEWLTGVVARCGRENVAIEWTEALRSRRKLALLVAKYLDVSVPRSA